MIYNTIKNINNFQYINNVTYELSNKLISEASIFVNTGKKEEGFTDTFIQSWLTKTPKITLNFDPDDIIKKYNIGKHSLTYSQLVEDIKLLINDDTLRKNMGERAREFAKNNFDINKGVNKLIHIINTI